MYAITNNVYNFTTGCNSRWKLCFLASTKPIVPPNRTRKPGDWDGVIHSRSSGAGHTRWYETQRRIGIPLNRPEGWTIPQSTVSGWDVCVYVKCHSYIYPALRDQVLSSCGGQSKVYCSDHNVPLICVPRKGHCKCSCQEGPLPGLDQQPTQRLGRQCQKDALYVCSSVGCHAAICKHHQVAVLENPSKFFVGHICSYRRAPGGHLGGMDNLDISNNPVDIPFFDPDETSRLREAEINEAQHDDFGGQDADDPAHSIPFPPDRTGNDMEGFDAAFRLMDDLGEDIFVTSANDGHDDLEDVPMEISAEENEMPQTIPATDAGTLPVFSLVESAAYTPYSATNHVILNNYGHMLMRRNKKLTGTLSQRHFLQRIVARQPGQSLPLVYPEGMLFSDIFCFDEKGHSIVGALPAALLHDDRTLKGLGYASLEDHFRTRISNPGLLASSNPRYHFFAFDALTNLGLRGCDSRVILRRGFAEIQSQGGVRIRGQEERVFDTEQVDSRPIVNKLAAAIGEDDPTYFYTHTCSMRTHYGMKILWDWLMGDGIMDILCDGDETDREQKDLRKYIIDSAGVLLLRSWMEMVLIWIMYITKSPEHPVGKVTKYMFRMELQDAKANLPHLHSMLWTDDDLGTEEGLGAALDRIRGFISDIIRPAERNKFIEEGVFPDDSAVLRFMEMVQTFLSHTHERRCFIHSFDKDTGLVGATLHCKANDNFRVNPSPSQHTFVPIPVEHSQEAIEVMQDIGVAKPPPSCHQPGDKLIFEALEQCLVAKKHYPPAHGDEGIISPTFGTLLPLNPNTDNVQFATGYTLSRYLAKYIMSIDLYNVINIRPPRPTGDSNTYEVKGDLQLNQKITGNRIHKPKTKSSNGRTPKSRECRAINVAEFYMMLFGYDPVMTNIPFMEVVTKPFEERAARERYKPLDRLVQSNPTLQGRALTAVNTVPSHHVRQTQNFPSWRMFTTTQVEKIEDDLQSPLSTDAVTIFGMRPPELRFVMRQSDYFRWFSFAKQSGDLSTLVSYCQTSLSLNCLKESLWVDARTYHVQIRRLAIPQIQAYILTAPDVDFGGIDAKQQMQALFGDIKDALAAAYPDLGEQKTIHNFVSEVNGTMLPVVWYRGARPTQVNRFLVHILLSMGYFVDEYDLFMCPSLRDCFIRGRLLDPNDPVESAKSLMKLYLLQQLSCLPAGTATFDRYLVAAYQSFMALFVHNTLFSDQLPTVLYCRLKNQTEDDIVNHQRQKKVALVKNLRSELLEAGITNLPSENQCLGATLTCPCSWKLCTIPRGNHQPLESYEEQAHVLLSAKSAVQHYTSASNDCTKSCCIVGAGGVGKTTVLQICLLFCISQGLMSATTSMVSERAQELAGTHIHELFAFPSHDQLSPGQMAERAIGNLFRNPAKLEFLRTLDVLGLDEAGAVACELLSSMDIVLRYIRGSNMPYGGLLIFASMDYLQIDPVKGRHALLSPLFVTSFVFHKLLHSVRAAHDAKWRRIQEITRMPPNVLVDPAIKAEFVREVTHVCTFVRHLDDPAIPRNALFAFGKRRPIKRQEKRILDTVVHGPPSTYVVSTARDEERTTDGNFRPASNVTSRLLSNKVKEPRRLVFFKGGRYQITYNKPLQFSNSQLAILFDLPTRSQIDLMTPITMVVAPPGCRLVPDDTVTKQFLLNGGWDEKQIAAPNRQDVHNLVGSVRARRRQYGLRHHIGSTYHGIMGQTLASVVTRVEGGDRTCDYGLWLAAQVVVLMSRTRLGSDTIFWMGEAYTPQKTADALYDQLQVSSPFRTYLANLLEQLCGMSNENTYAAGINHSSSIYRPRDVSLPHDMTGQAYILVSIKDLNFTYIGSCQNIGIRLSQHNSGYGSMQTSSPTLRPWALLAYVTGFDGNSHAYTSFENRWISAKERLLRSTTQHASVEAIVNLAKTLIATQQQATPQSQLRFVDCGSIARARNI